MGIALVTGATSGIGEELCWQLAAAKHDLVLVARNMEKLHTLAQDLKQIAGVKTEIIVADLTRRPDIEKVATRLKDHTAPVGLLVNNAGAGLGQEFLGGDIEREEQALDLMVRAVLVLSHAASAAMVKRGRGAILNMSSMAANMPIGTYAAHKRWVLAFSEGLAADLAGTGVSVTAVKPGYVRTNFFKGARIDGDQVSSALMLSPEMVATSALDGVRRGQTVVVPSWRYRILNFVLHAAPRPLVRVAFRLAGPEFRDI